MFHYCFEIGLTCFVSVVTNSINWYHVRFLWTKRFIFLSISGQIFHYCFEIGLTCFVSFVRGTNSVIIVSLLFIISTPNRLLSDIRKFPVQISSWGQLIRRCCAVFLSISVKHVTTVYFLILSCSLFIIFFLCYFTMKYFFG